MTEPGEPTRRRVRLGGPARARRSRRWSTPTRRTPTTRWAWPALVDDGRVVTGCNVENAAYGVALCAECGMVSQLHITGGGRLTHVVCVNAHGEVIMPCGRCRQLLWENGGPELLLWTVSGVKPMTEVLPDAFGADDLD